MQLAVERSNPVLNTADHATNDAFSVDPPAQTPVMQQQTSNTASEKIQIEGAGSPPPPPPIETNQQRGRSPTTALNHDDDVKVGHQGHRKRERSRSSSREQTRLQSRLLPAARDSVKNTSTTTTTIHHDHTLVAISPTSTTTAAAPYISPPNSFPIDAFELAAQALTTPPVITIPVSVRRPTLAPMVFGTAQAKGQRVYMEDRMTVVPTLSRSSSSSSTGDDDVNNDVQRSFAAVYDGHNGTLAADHAAEHLHALLAAEPALSTCTGDGTAPTTIHNEEFNRMSAALTYAFEATDREILTRCQVENGRGGATGVVVLRIGETLYAAHCGDSRAVMCRGGEPLRLTEDHKPNLPRERKRVEDLGGRVDFARCWRVIVDPGGGRPASGLAVSRSFGDPDFKQPLHLVTATPDVMSERLCSSDAFVILASDGLWDVLSDRRACQVVSKKLAAATASLNEVLVVDERLLATAAAEALVQSALDAGTMDNVSAIVGLMKWIV